MPPRLRPPGELTWADCQTAANDPTAPAEGNAIRGLIHGLRVMFDAAVVIVLMVYLGVWILG